MHPQKFCLQIRNHSREATIFVLLLRYCSQCTEQLWKGSEVQSSTTYFVSFKIHVVFYSELPEQQ